MAVTFARDNDKFEKLPKVGASGGNAVEGYGTAFMSKGHNIKDDVLTRSKEDEEKRFAEAKKFMDSQRKGDVDVKKEQVKVAEAKPTAPGTDVAALEAGKGQPAKVTEKVEVPKDKVK